MKRVSVYKYKGMFFASKKEVTEYIEVNKRHRAHQKIVEQVYSVYENDPLGFKIPDGKYMYFDFLIDYNNDTERRRCFKAKKLSTALNMLRKVEFEFADYECQLLDKNKMGTGVYLDLYKIPQPHWIHSVLN